MVTSIIQMIIYEIAMQSSVAKAWVNDSEKNDVDEWVRHTLKFDDNGRLAETYAYYHVNESQPYRTETNNLLLVVDRRYDGRYCF